jgi:Ca2+-binding EF-hand superfamily protein
MSRKPLYFSQSQFKGKARGNSRGRTPDKRSLTDDLDMNNSDITLMKEAFDIMDIQGSGVINKDDLSNILNLLKADCEVGEKILKGLSNLDEINFYEFVQHVDAARGNAKTIEGCEKLFELISNEGKIDEECLKKLCRELGEKINEDQISESIEKIASGKGFISAEEFKALMIGKRRK